MTQAGAALEAIENAAVLGARQDERRDKSDWIRIWCIAREERGLPYDSLAWNTDYSAFCVRARQAEDATVDVLPDDVQAEQGGTP